MSGSNDGGRDGSDALIDAVRGNPHAMVNLARTLLVPQGRNQEALDLCRDTLALSSSNDEAAMLVRHLRTRGVGSWYFTMVQDAGRHDLYDKALRRLITPGSRVLDIGAGTGLFAMMAARAGAGHVYACESHPAVADACRAVIRQNGYEDKVTVLPMLSSQAEIGRDLDGPADVVLWDNLANNVFGVGAAKSMADAMERLTIADPVVIPGRIEICARLVDCQQEADEFMTAAHGFDLTAFNALRPHDITWARHRWQDRSDAATLFDVDFTNPLSPQRGTARVKAGGGRITGIVQWLRFHLTEDLVYETDDSGAKAFGLQYHALDPFVAGEGEEIAIGAAHDLDRVWFWVDR